MRRFVMSALLAVVGVVLAIAPAAASSIGPTP